MTISRPSFLVSRDRADEPAVLAPGWPVVFVEDLHSLEDLRRWDWDFVFPLVSPADGVVQGMLEFLGLPYAGASMAGMVWADRQNRRQRPSSGDPTSCRLLCEARPRNTSFLRLSGWSLVTSWGDEPTSPCRIDVSPTLQPGGDFLRLLAAEGVSVETFFQAEIAAGLSRYRVEHALKTHYKDTI